MGPRVRWRPLAVLRGAHAVEHVLLNAVHGSSLTRARRVRPRSEPPARRFGLIRTATVRPPRRPP